MSDFNYGGPAFPVINSPTLMEQSGMTLRDYFAAKAMQSHLAAQWEKFYDESEKNPFAVFDSTDVSEMAYEVADAMLVAREVQA